MTATKKQKPDVLDELLCGPSGSEEKMQPEIEQLSQLLNPLAKVLAGKAGSRRKAPGLAGPDPGGEVISGAGVAEEQERAVGKKKVSYYLSQEIAARLNDVQMRIQQLMPAEIKKRLTKSLIVEQAIRQILTEFESREKESLLMTWISERLE